MEVRVVEQQSPVTTATVVSPKVKAGTIAGISISVFLSALSLSLSLVTPEMFAVLGPYAILLSTFLTALGAGIAAYLKTDPDRISQATIQQYAEQQVTAAIAEYKQAEGRHAERLAEAAESAKAEVAELEQKLEEAKQAQPVTGTPVYVNDGTAVG